MHFSTILSLCILTPIIGHAAPSRYGAHGTPPFWKRGDNMCSAKSPPVLCKANSSVTVEETALRAYKFYRAFVVDGNPKEMFSYIDSTYKQHHPGYSDGPQAIWSLFCNGKPVGNEKSGSWCFEAATNMSWAQYGVTDRWRWVDGCVHEHWDQGESITKSKCYNLNTTMV